MNKINKVKPTSIISKQFENGDRCKVPECNEHLTIYKGEGENIYCRKHQLALVSNGGLARPDRLYTFHKEWVCSKCGYDPRTDPAFDVMLDPVKKNQAQRSMIIGDHKVRSRDHGPDSEQNVQTLCFKCNIIKSAEAEDWSRPAMSVAP